MSYLLIFLLFLASPLIYDYIKSYLHKKAENLATKKDINRITKEIEEVKTFYRGHYDLSKIEKEFYTEMTIQIENFLSEIRRKELNEGIAINNKIIFDDLEIKESYLNFIDSANKILSKSFVFLSEDNYSNLRDAINIERGTSFRDLRLDILDAMRKSLRPDTEMHAKEDLRELYYE